MVSALVVGTNTYQTRADADAILADNIATSAWAFQGGSTKDQALITAFHLLETESWQGTKTSDVQTAQHPRTGLTNCNGDSISSATIAPDILRAHALLAYELTQNPALASSANTGSNIKKLQAGSASIEFHERSDDDDYPTSRYPTNVQSLINCYLRSSSAASEAEAIGATGESLFDDSCDDYDRNLPF